MAAKAQVVGSVVAGFPSPAEQYAEPPLDINEYLVNAYFFKRYTNVLGVHVHYFVNFIFKTFLAGF